MHLKQFELFRGDCLKQMQRLADATVDLLCCDLPYGTTANKWDTTIPLDQLWPAWRRVMKPGAAAVLFSQQPFTTTLALSNIKQLRTEWIWEKHSGTGFLNARRYPLKSHENILAFCDRLPRYNPQKSFGAKPYKTKNGGYSSNYNKVCGGGTINTDGTRFPTTVLKFKSDRGLHPTQKPVALLEYLLRTYSNEGDVVLDCCMGSVTAGVAAINTGRRFIGIERDAKYFATASERIAQAAEELAA